MPASPSIAPTPARPIARDARAEAERAFFEGMDLLAGVAMAFDGICAADTPGKARILADMLEASTARVNAAHTLLLRRAGAH